MLSGTEVDDARICRDRCLEAMSTAEDLETARALWCAAKRYAERGRAEALQGPLNRAAAQ